jgi:uncharacterized protein (UPF0332 family)
VTEENRRVHVTAEVTRAEEALRAARELLKLGLFNDAVSRAYYAALHFALAALLTEGVEPKTHGGVGAMLALHFIRSGRIPPERGKDLSRLEQFRTEADYNRFFVFDDAGAAAEVEVAGRFCGALRDLLLTDGWIETA